MRLALIATGGTIAGLGTADSYRAAQIPAAALFDAAPALHSIATWYVEQPFALDSRNIQPSHWLVLARSIQTLLAQPDIDGVVVTHGTDTLEETAFALHLLIPSGKPVVITAAMRPADAPDADGPRNLLHAAQVAADPTAAGRGVMVVAAGLILAAAHVRKQHTMSIDALQATSCGLLGNVGAEGIEWDPAHSQSIDMPHFDLAKLEGELQRVDIVMAYAGQTGSIIDSLVNTGARGIVIAAAGCGSISSALRPALRRAHGKGVVILRATRVANGGVPRNYNADDDTESWLNAEMLSPVQARIVLMFALATGLDLSATQDKITALSP